MESHIEKSDRTEAEIRTLYITPAIKAAGWDLANQVREEFQLTDGGIVVRGKLHTRGKKKRADYVLNYKPNIPLAVVEAKDNKHGIGAGMQQALEYADMRRSPSLRMGYHLEGTLMQYRDKGQRFMQLVAESLVA